MNNPSNGKEAHVKRIFAFLLAALLFCAGLALTSCGEPEIITPVNTVKPIGELAYKSTTVFTHKALSINYPTGWTETRGDYDTVYDHKTGSIVSIEYVDEVMFPENITDTEIEAALIADFRSMYVTIESITTSHITNKNNLDMVRVTMTAFSEIWGRRYSLTELYITLENATYVVCINESFPDKRLYNTVVNSISLSDSYDYEADIGTDENIYTHDKLSFEYPDDLFITGNEITNARKQRYVYVYTPDMLLSTPDEDETDEEEETSPLVFTNSNEYYVLMNDNGVSIEKTTGTAVNGEFTLYYTYLQVNPKGEPYLIEIIELNPDAQLFETIFNSINIIE